MKNVILVLAVIIALPLIYVAYSFSLYSILILEAYKYLPVDIVKLLCHSIVLGPYAWFVYWLYHRTNTSASRASLPESE